MRRLGFLGSKAGLVCLAVLAALGTVAWLERVPLLRWYYLRELAGAAEADRGPWVERVAGLGEEVVPGLLDILGREDARACANARAALARLVQTWGLPDPRSAALAEQLVRAFPGRSLLGQLAILDLEAELVLPAPGHAPPPVSALTAAGYILQAAAQGPRQELKSRALALGDALGEQPLPKTVVAAIHDLARAGFAAPGETDRLRAIHLARGRALRSRTDLLELILPLLRDPSAVVRREALRAVALKQDIISDDDLLTWLHDPDKEVRSWCRKALLARGRSDMEIALGRQITDSRPVERLKIFQYLRQLGDREAAVWIRRLCDDPEPALRIAAARAAVEMTSVDLSDRLRDMAERDCSPTVRQEAEYYYKQR